MPKPFGRHRRKPKTGFIAPGKRRRERTRKARRLWTALTSGSIGIYHATILHEPDELSQRPTG